MQREELSRGVGEGTKSDVYVCVSIAEGKLFAARVLKSGAALQKGTRESRPTL